MKGPIPGRLDRPHERQSFTPRSPGHAVEGPAHVGAILELQRLAGNRATTELLAAQRMTFNRFSWLGKLTNWGSYNAAELEILRLEKSANEYLEGLSSYQNDKRFKSSIAKIDKEFADVSSGDYKTTQYPSLLKTMRRIQKSAENLSYQVTRRDLDRDLELDKILAGAFEVGEGGRSNRVSQKDFEEIRILLQDIMHGQRSNLSIETGTIREYDFAQRARSQGMAVPMGLPAIEQKISDIRNVKLEAVFDRIGELQREQNEVKRSGREDAEKGAELKAITERLDALAKEKSALAAEEAALIEEYEALVDDVVRTEVMKDLVLIAQTGVGRTLLEQLAKQSLDDKEKAVKILAYQEYKAPDAGSGYANYTPQYFRAADTVERFPGASDRPAGALAKLEPLKETNPWQENERTDITLFHELVHTRHFQSGTDKDTGQLVPKDKAVHPVDAPYEVDDRMGGRTTGGVREEEYFTVGLGEYKDAPLTENKYRAERRDLGEDVAPRTSYTHMDEAGERVAA